MPPRPERTGSRGRERITLQQRGELLEELFVDAYQELEKCLDPVEKQYIPITSMRDILVTEEDRLPELQSHLRKMIVLEFISIDHRKDKSMCFKGLMSEILPVVAAEVDEFGSFSNDRRRMSQPWREAAIDRKTLQKALRKPRD
jgi:hypothetical protein